MANFSFSFDLNTFQSSYEILIAHIITVYLPGVMTICRIFNNPNDVLAQFKISSIPIVTLKESLPIDSANNPLLAGIELGCNVFVVHHGSIISFMDQYVVRHDEATYRNPNKTVILLMDSAQSEDPNVLDELREHPNLGEIMNLLILRLTPDLKSIELLTHRFVGSDAQSIDLLLLDTFEIANKTFGRDEQLFPDKTINLQGKAIRLATFHIPPHVILTKSESRNQLVKSGDQTYEMDGVDGLLMVEFCRQYNCSVELVIDEVNMWGKIEANKTGNGILGDLAERRADVGCAAMNNWYELLQFLSFSKPIQTDSVTCLVPKPILQPAWKIMVIAFSVPVWISTVGIFFTILFMHLLMDRLNQSKNHQQSFARSCLNLFAILLQQAASIRKQNASDVILSVALLVFTFNLVNIYSSRNASLRTIPLFGPSINTLDDLAKSGLILLQTHEAWIFSLILSENPVIRKLVSNFQAYPASVLRELADQGNVAFIIGRMNNGHLMIGGWITAENVHNYQLMREDLYYDYEIAMATKTWPLMEQFNTLILRTAEAKIRHYQELDAIYKSSDYFVQTAAINSRLREFNAPRPLSLTGILGIFSILGVGLLTATVVFLMEISPIKSKSRIHWFIGNKIYLWLPFCSTEK